MQCEFNWIFLLKISPLNPFVTTRAILSPLRSKNIVVKSIVVYKLKCSGRR